MVMLNIDGQTPGASEATRAAAASMQMTLAHAVKLSGRGLHSGGDTSVFIHPAPENTGVVFRNGAQRIRGLAGNVVDTSRGTTIGLNGARVRTVEHLMAALRGKGVDNAVVEVAGPETPALDGSALPYVEAIDSVGLTELDARRRTVAITEPIYVQQEDSFILAVPAPRLSITYVMNYDHPMIGSQSATYVTNKDDFGCEIAPARTFVLYEEVAGLLDNDLARGGSLDNVIVVWRDRLSSELRFPDELVRHKLIDLLGDLSLVGGFLQAEVLAVKSGHTLNVEFARNVSNAYAERHPRARRRIHPRTIAEANDRPRKLASAPGR